MSTKRTISQPLSCEGHATLGLMSKTIMYSIAALVAATLLFFALTDWRKPGEEADYAKIIGRATGELAKESSKPTYEEIYPTLRTLQELELGFNVAGDTSPLDGKWSQYTSGGFGGFSIEYFSPKSPREDSIEDIYGVHSYKVNLSQMDEYIISVWISPARFHTIDEWRKAQPEYQTPNYVFMHRTINGHDAVTTWHVPEFPPTTDAQIERNTYLIRDDIMYQITTRGLPSEEYERIINSFRFLKD